VLFRLQKRIFKAVREGDRANARKLQKIVLFSHAARMPAIRQVPQLNQGKKTAGIDGKKFLTFKRALSIRENSPPTYKDLETSKTTCRNSKFLAQGGVEINRKKTKMTASTDEFVFLG
jgi:N-terminal domain of reverse transcriptase